MHCLNHAVNRSLLQNAVLEYGDRHGFYTVLHHTLCLNLLSVNKTRGRTNSSSTRCVLLVRSLAARTTARTAAAGELIELIIEIFVKNAGSTEKVGLRKEIRFERIAVEEILEQVVRIAEAKAFLERKEIVLKERLVFECRLVRVVAVSERSAVVRSSLVVQVALIVGAFLVICLCVCVWVWIFIEMKTGVSEKRFGSILDYQNMGLMVM